ncbi:hypothetical protein A7A08_01355 [Methyloligella halotolerans]|uniref:Uncharacterized protein n=1 Tax=Methyloligella halotolerans TaxID=1177755 RepID=A0A1E2RZ50_9HYPH|nr:hypothetical protein [Methyloligella halotolerans]ODA67329.1 hypothetical protein A7A08_01355 [Methyloligella halotolerans]
MAHEDRTAVSRATTAAGGPGIATAETTRSGTAETCGAAASEAAAAAIAESAFTAAGTVSAIAAIDTEGTSAAPAEVSAVPGPCPGEALTGTATAA